jgi:hypothetical protein
MTTAMTTDDRERIVLLEQREQLRQITRQHEDRVRAEATQFHEDLVRLEARFADQMALETIGSFRDLLTAMAARWRAAAEIAGQEYEADTEATLNDCAREIEDLLETVQHVQEPK